MKAARDLRRGERELALIAAGTALRRDRQRARATSLSTRIDPARLAEGLRARRILGVLGPRLLELVPELRCGPLAQQTVQAIAAGRRHASFLMLSGERIVAALADEGILSAPLKGPLLGQALYGEVGRRSSNDIDLLLAPHELAAAVPVITALGYKAPEDHRGSSGLPLLHYELTHLRGELPAVELHWRIHWYEERFAQERLMPPPGSRPGEWRARAVDELAALLLFYARDGFAGLRLACDLAAWWDLHGEDLAPGAIASLIEEYPAFGRVLPAALLVAERLLGVPAARMFAPTGAAGARVRAGARLANPYPMSSAAQLYAEMGLIDGLLAPPSGLKAFCERQLVPPRAVLEHQARGSARRSPRGRFARAAGMLVRYCLAVPRLLRGPEHSPRSL